MKKIFKIGLVIGIIVFLFFHFFDNRSDTEIFNDAMKKISELKNYHFEISADTTVIIKGIEIEIPITEKIDVDNKSKNSYFERTITVLQKKQTTKLYISEKFHKQYIKIDENPWKETILSSNPSYPDQITNYENLKKVNETKEEYHYQVIIPATKENPFIYSDGNNKLTITKDITMNIYINKKTNYISKIEMEILEGTEANINEEVVAFKKIKYTMTYSKYNENPISMIPYDIIFEATENKYQDLEDMFDF